MSVQWESAFALLELPSSLNTSTGYEGGTLAPANTGSSFFQNLLKKINFGGSFGNTSTQNTQTSQYNTTTQNQNTTNTGGTFSPGTVQTSSYDEEYQKILKQNLGGLPTINTTSNNKNNGVDVSIPTLTSANNQNNFLTKEEIEIRLQSFIKAVNDKKNSNNNPQTNSAVAPTLTPQQQQDYFNQTGKTWDSNYFNQRNFGYFTPEQAAVFSNDPYVKSIYNPSVRTDFSSDYTPAQQYINVMMNPGNFSRILGSVGELDVRLFKILSGGWLETKASNFGLNTNGAPDTVIKPQYGCQTAMSSLSASGPVKVCNTSTCVVSFPREVINYYYGKIDWSDRRAIYARYKQIAGTRVEVVNLENGTCAVAPLWEIGPGHGESLKNGFGIDLTYCVKVNMLETKSGAPRVKYRPVPTGKEGCEDYPNNRKVAPTITKK